MTLSQGQCRTIGISKGQHEPEDGPSDAQSCGETCYSKLMQIHAELQAQNEPIKSAT